MRTALLSALLAAPLIMAPALAAPQPHRATKPGTRPAARAPANTDWTRVIVQTPEGGYRMGNPAAKVKLIEYGARTCPTCARFAIEGVPALTSQYVATGKVSYEFRDFPVHGAIDLAPILLGRCVPPSRYFTLLDAMFTNQQSLLGDKGDIPADDKEKLGKATPNQVAAYFAKFFGYDALAAQYGVTPARATQCLANPAGIQAIAREANAANTRYKLPGTPAFLINGTLVAGASSWAALEPELRAKIAS